MSLYLPQILNFLEHYKYIVIFPVMIVEGPIITVITGFLVYLKVLNIFILFPLLIVGDLIGDSAYYAIGRYGRRVSWMRKLGYTFGYNAESKQFIEKHFEKHTAKTLLLAKVSHGLGAMVQITAGMAHVNFWKYIWIEALGTVPKTLILLIVGYYLGSSYVTINSYFQSIATVVTILVCLILLYLVLGKYVKRYFK